MKNVFKILIIVLAIIALNACAPMVQLKPGAEQVRIAKSDPPDNFKEIGPITATDGSGCGSFGYRGKYDRAVINLKNKGMEKGADYIQIYTLVEPHRERGCYNNEFTINATAFKKVRSEPSAIPIVEKHDNNNIEARLKKLNSLKDKGLITEQEYNEKRNQILKEL